MEAVEEEVMVENEEEKEVRLHRWSKGEVSGRGEGESADRVRSLR